MTLDIQATHDNVWTLAPLGRLDLPTARAVEDSLNDLLDAGRARLVIDLSNVVYVASAGLKALLVGLRRARLLNGDLRIASMSDRVREVFEMSGFDQVFQIFPDTASAVASFEAAG